MKIKVKWLLLVILFGCSGLGTKLYKVHHHDRSPSSEESELSFIEQINTYELSSKKKKLLSKDDEDLLEAKGRLDLIFQFARTNPLNFFKELREKAPVFRSAGGGTQSGLLGRLKGTSVPNVYVVSTHKLVQEVLNENTIFTVAPYTKQMDKTVGPFMLGHEKTADNPKKKGHGINFNIEKTAMRHLIYKSGNDLERVKEITRKTVQNAFKNVSVSNRSHLDVVKNVTRDVPIQVVREYFGFKASVPRMKSWSRATQHSFFHNPGKNKGVDRDAVRAGLQMKKFLEGTRNRPGFIAKVKKELEEGKRDDVNDTVTTMIRASKAHAEYGLDETRLATNIMGLLVGAVETGSSAITQALEFILDNPVIYDQAVEAMKAGDDELFSKIVWESLRFNPVNPWVARYSVKEHKLSDGTVIEAGSLVLAATESAMFDDNVFSKPELFSTERNHADYFHLGFARHRCLGDDVAMAFVPEAIKELLKKPYLRRAQAGASPDFKDGPFPENWELRWGVLEKPYKIDYKFADKYITEKIRSKLWIKDTIGYVLKKIWDARTNYRKDIVDTLKLLFSDDKKIDGVVKFSQVAKLALDESTTPGELKEACMDINKLSHKIFPNVETRYRYCKVRIDFRVCYALSAKVLEMSSEDSYKFCADDQSFLTNDEKVMFKSDFEKHPSFNFLAK